MDTTHWTHWSAIMLHTMDVQHTSVRVNPAKSVVLRQGLSRGTSYWLSLSGGFQLEIVKVIGATQAGMLIVSRGQEGTQAYVWPAGTLMEAKITAKALDDLALDPRVFLNTNRDVFLASNGDVITKRMPTQ